MQSKSHRSSTKVQADTLGADSDLAALPFVISERANSACHGHVTQVDPCKLLLRMARLYAAARSSKTAYDFSLAEPVPSPVADESVLEGLVGRLICNAMDNIGDGWGTITLSTGVLGDGPGPLFEGDLAGARPEEGYVYLEVHDTGGLPAGLVQSPVLEPFCSPRYHGTPVGLEAARKLLEAQGARILVEKGSWGGTAVMLLLPYKRR